MHKRSCRRPGVESTATGCAASVAGQPSMYRRQRPTLRLAWLVPAALSVLMAATITPAWAAGPGLPRTYSVQRIDSPLPSVDGTFGSGAASAGDLNGDGKDDILTFQLPRSPNNDGQVFVISGADGSLIDTIVAPDPGGTGNVANFAFPWMSKLGTNRSEAPFTDLASCPGGRNGALCPNSTIGPADGVPEILVGARGVDARGLRDAGRVYVFDGKTRALLKRIDQPAADTTPVALSRSGGTWFGRSVLNPAGVPGCAGNSSVGPCSDRVPRAVEIGDLDAGGQPDIVIGASATTEDQASAHPDSHCSKTPGARCQGSGRVYIYRGEEIVGSSSGEILDGTTNGNSAGGSNGTETFKRLRNIASQADDLSASVSADSELFGNSLTAVGDVGSCDLSKAPAGTGPGDRCPRAASTALPDSKPDFHVGALRVDLPINAPQASLADAGVNFLIDGATGTILSTYEHPEPQPGAVFGSQFTQPAVGNLGDSALPDLFIPAAGQNTSVLRGGRGYVLNGNFKTGVTSVNMSRIDDPTPHAAENFAYASVGVGDLVGGADAPANEILTGSEGPFFGLAPRESVINDVHFYNGFTGRVLQTIEDPDRQGGDGFGGALVGLGDLNGDGFLDFAASAESYTGTTGVAEGRVHIFRSDNSPAPTPPAPPAPPAAPLATPAATPAAAPVAAPIVRKRGRLSAAVTPSSDLRPAYVFRASGRLTLPAGVSKAAGCKGRVSVQVKRGAVTISTRRASLTRNCTYSSRVAFANKRRFGTAAKLKFTVRFLGNARVSPAIARARFARVRR